MIKILSILVVPICAQTVGQDFLQKQDVAAVKNLPAVTAQGDKATPTDAKAAAQVAQQAARLATQAAAVATASAGSATAAAAPSTAKALSSNSVAAAQLATEAAASQAGVAAAAAAQAARLASRAAQSAAVAAAATTNATTASSVASQAALSNAFQAASSPVVAWHPWHPLQIWSQLSTVERLLTGISFAGMIKALCMAGNILVQWCYYGFFAYFVTARSGFLILVHSNILGAILGTYYTITYFRNCKHPEMLQNLQKYLAAVISLVMLQLCTLFMLPVERALFMTGLVSSFCSFVGALSMLFVLPAVLKAKDSRAIPGPLVLANLVSAIVWCICGAMLADPMIAAPNLVCCVSSSLCLYLKFLYPSAEDSKVPEETKGPSNTSPRRTVRPRPWKLGQPLPTTTDATEATPLSTTEFGDCGTGGTF